MNWRSIFAIDYRSIVLFRKGLALCILWDCFERLKTVNDFLTDFGLYPRSLFQFRQQAGWTFSFHNWSGTPEWSTFLLVVIALLSVTLFFGIYPRVCSLFLWILTISLHHRNPNDIFGGDILKQVTLFWSMFLPA